MSFRSTAWAVFASAGLFCSGCYTGPSDDGSKPKASAESAATTNGEKGAASGSQNPSAKPSPATASGKSSEGPQSSAATPKNPQTGPTKGRKGAESGTTGVEPFQPPSLAELDKNAAWEPQPVLDGLELMRARQSKEQPLATVQEALALKNTSPEINRKILSAMGRMPAKDSDVDWNATFIHHVGADVKSTNPVLISSTIEFDLTGMTGLSLFGFDWNMVPFASKSAVVSWQTSKDRLLDKVVLRDDMTWSDGKPVTAHDVVFSFKLILDPRVPVPAVRSGTDQIRWIEAYDDHTLVFFHKEAAATNVWNLNFPILPKHIYENYEEDPTLQNSPRFVKYENDPIVGGAYRIKERRRDEEIVLERRESYYTHNGKQVRPKPYFKTIRMRILPDMNTSILALKKGDIDEMQLVPLSVWRSQTAGDDFYALNTKVQAVEWTEFHFIWNCASPLFADKRVRTAMSYAMDYDEMLKTVLNGLATQCVGPFHPDSWMSAKPAPTPYKQDLDKAEALLKDAGWEDHDGDGIRDKTIDGQGVKFDFDLLCASSNPDGIQICTLMKEALDRIGIACTVRPVEFTVLQERSLKHNFQAEFAGWGSGSDPDTSENIYSTDAAKHGRNYGSYSNSEVDELYRRGKVEFDRKKRAEIYGKIQLLMWDDQPYTWLYYRPALYGFNKKLRGYVFSPRGPYHYSPGLDNIYKPLH